ncbi:hypothetical protein GYMLUDRAFT_46414 [Collybiopsis luxurians FD-317 M1]|uniref:Cytochrome P450 n=1 Tax=Collybiopsis luxurians FD-317 M1 TaxID=944289 RepID=A0A0D0C413_9AGAR|nr:hypothetical protein GYMLUDRAFT_46414 [Collybiopsis luxurians FD-317 M1]
MSLSPSSQILTLGAIFLATLLLPKFLRWRARMVKLNAIPTVGNSGIFSSYISARRFKDHAMEILQEGYEKYPGRAFKVPFPDGWEVIVSGKTMVDEIRKANDQDLSPQEALTKILQTDYTLGRCVREDSYQIDVVRTALTRNLGARFEDLRDEIKDAFADEIPAKESEWMKVPMLYTAMKIISRTSNRYFVGSPLCRDPDYMKLNIEFTVDAFNGAKTLQHYPGFLKPLIRQFLTKVPAGVARAIKHLKSVIEERLRKEEEYGTTDWPGKPNDLISWLLDEANTEDRRKDIIYNIVSRVLVINFAAIHTTSVTFTNSLYYLAANPHIVQPLREEVQACVEKHGWTKAAMGQMRKLDSYMKEVQRLVGVSGLGMSRMAMKDFTFSDGTVVPAGTMVHTVSYALHHDAEVYEDPESLNAFRFSNMRVKEGEGFKHQMVAQDPSYALFGSGGRHMCPGRFFAVNELKALLGHVLVTYDIKFENNRGVPPPHWDGAGCTPNRTALVMFKKRAV